MSQDQQHSCSLVGGGAIHWMRQLLQILLLAIFLHFFGLPAIQKYQRKEVMVVETTKTTNGIPLPAITLMFGNNAPENQEYRSCYHLNVSVEDCLEKNTPNVSKILHKILLGFEKKETLVLGENDVIGDLAAQRAGPIFTVKLPLKIGPNHEETQFFLFLAPTFVNVMLHDPDFFIFNDNPYGLPTVTRVFDAGSKFPNLAKVL